MQTDVGKGDSRMNMTDEKNITVRGIGVGSGSVSGPLYFLNAPATAVVRTYAGREAEWERLAEAVEQVRRNLHALADHARKTLGESEAEIFEIHEMLLEDEDFSDARRAYIERGECAEDAVWNAAELCATQLSALSDTYLRARAADLRDIAGQIRATLSGERGGALPDDGRAYVLVARDLAPSETVMLDKRRILGFVTFEGTPNSHTAILARAMGLPALVGAGEIDARFDGTVAHLSAEDGTLTLLPDAEATRAFALKEARSRRLAEERDAERRSVADKPALTRSGKRILIYANVGDLSEAADAKGFGADGIGLLRSELLYLTLDRCPTEEELYNSYRAVAEIMGERRVVIRTLDIGADKRIGYLKLPTEENPALGFRGVRISLARRELFKTQLRAILRASAHGRIAIMIPMVVSVEEVRSCRECLRECSKELTQEGVAHEREPEFGIMIETPAAAVMSEELAEEVDFFSVGTNDLLQYTLATDRQNAAVAHICEENREPVLRLIEQSARAIHKAGGWIGICGELAGDLTLTSRFVAMGIDELSVSPPYLSDVRLAVCECD